jgi:hypothetical protein
MKQKIIFLDIDGVLMPGKSYILSNNNELLSKLNRKEIKLKEFSLGLEFDKISVELINRLCDKSGAKIVLITNWRRNIGVKETKDKLIEQGLKYFYFHDDYYCPHRMTSEKIHDMKFWLDEHRSTNKPIKEKFDLNKSFEQRTIENQEYQEKYSDFGVDYIVIDDQNIYGYGKAHEHQITTNYYEGFSTDNYRVALGAFNSEDLMFGVFSISNYLLEEVKKSEKFRNEDYIKCIYWLYSLNSNEGYTQSRSSDLSYKSCLLSNTDLSIFGISNIETRELYNQRKNFFFKELRGEIK